MSALYVGFLELVLVAYVWCLWLMWVGSYFIGFEGFVLLVGFLGMVVVCGLGVVGLTFCWALNLGG